MVCLRNPKNRGCAKVKKSRKHKVQNVNSPITVIACYEHRNHKARAIGGIKIIPLNKLGFEG